MSQALDITTKIPYDPTPSKQYNAVNLTGRQFGRLRVFALWAVYKSASHWLCRCECGSWRVVLGSNLSKSLTGSCGCQQKDIMRDRKRHGESVGGRLTTEYRIYLGIRERCNCPTHHKYPIYGGRGIECRIDTFEEFLAEVGRRPSKSHTIDRIDNDKHYERGNLRWATPREQGNNKRSNHLVTFRGETMSLSEWARTVGMSPGTLWSRLFVRHWTVEKALTQKVGG